MAGVAAVTDRDYVDADNAFITGGSFGGFMTGWAVGHTDAFAGAVAQRGVYDLTGFYGTTDAYALVEVSSTPTPCGTTRSCGRSPRRRTPTPSTPHAARALGGRLPDAGEHRGAVLPAAEETRR